MKRECHHENSKDHEIGGLGRCDQGCPVGDRLWYRTSATDDAAEADTAGDG